MTPTNLLLTRCSHKSDGVSVDFTAPSNQAFFSGSASPLPDGCTACPQGRRARPLPTPRLAGRLGTNESVPRVQEDEPIRGGGLVLLELY